MNESEFINFKGHVIDVDKHQQALRIWGAGHYRPFPWRETSDPYALLIAEVMLHRTQALQVLPVYQQFMRYYPTVQTLAVAPSDEVHQVLYSLGLRWRAGSLIEMAHSLVAHHNGVVPQDRAELLSLPGVSDYIASAVRCFAWNMADALVDTNTVRVIGRIFGMPIKDSSRRNGDVRALIAALVDPVSPRSYHYALLDLADQICTKRRAPMCLECPLVRQCAYGSAASARVCRR